MLDQKSRQEHMKWFLSEIHGAHNERSVPCGIALISDVCLRCSEQANG